MTTLQLNHCKKREQPQDHFSKGWLSPPNSYGFIPCWAWTWTCPGDPTAKTQRHRTVPSAGSEGTQLAPLPRGQRGANADNGGTRACGAGVQDMVFVLWPECVKGIMNDK